VRSGDLVVRSVEEGDVPALARWLRDPEVLEWYRGRDRPLDEPGVRALYLVHDGHVRHCVVEWDGERVGYAEVRELAAGGKARLGYGPDEPAVFRIELFIGEADFRDHGVGTQVVEALAFELLAHRDAERVVLDPQQVNVRAVRCYEKAGFDRVRPLPAHVQHEGEPRDAWLYERTA
jgi:aminoglycoside 6'-N-acetyltransferase